MSLCPLMSLMQGFMWVPLLYIKLTLGVACTLFTIVRIFLQYSSQPLRCLTETYKWINVLSHMWKATPVNVSRIVLWSHSHILSCMVSTAVDRYFEDRIYKSSWRAVSQPPSGKPAILLYYYYPYISFHFEIWHHQFKVVERREDAPRSLELLLNHFILRKL